MILRRTLSFLAFLAAAAFSALALKTLYDIKTGKVVIGAAPGPGAGLAGSRPSGKDVPTALGSPLSGPGRPSGGYTNETLHDFVEKDMKRMGISKVLPRGSMDSGFGGYLAEHAQGPLTREEARTLWVRYQNELSGGPVPKGVVPVGGRTVSLIPGREEGGGRPDAASAIPGRRFLERPVRDRPEAWRTDHPKRERLGRSLGASVVSPRPGGGLQPSGGRLLFRGAPPSGRSSAPDRFGFRKPGGSRRALRVRIAEFRR